ncbi:MAG: radical SAM protein [Theionarchaea archaeon]|nr:radical SAM protein [Theionarchaea archaeon]MBU6999803.1 radical SAM protein [Theionarchaea archaeon]MBU7020223.1 radical SAM protein [Theionarchaea archaeon]MBU7033658.1 radical SAM protein [Theionarchaea archaeon]MBU7040097.1 radical SAM protein [Theionarchaea archaeon]
MKELESCQLCEWRCKVNRISGETGICGIGIPRVVVSMLHPAPPASFDAFMEGCNFICLGCQNYPLSMLQERGKYIPPEEWAEMGVAALNSIEGRQIGADRLFFTGGEPTCSLPWVEAAALSVNAKVNFDTNGFMTEASLERILTFSDSITFDIKAFTDEVHILLTGARVGPVLRNVEYLVEHAMEKVYEFRVLVMPGLMGEAVNIARFLANLSEDAPVSFLAFRPNFVLERARGSSTQEMESVVDAARDCGLRKVDWAGMPDIPGEKEGITYFKELASQAGCYKIRAGRPRLCTCRECTMRSYAPQRRT